MIYDTSTQCSAGKLFPKSLCFDQRQRLDCNLLPLITEELAAKAMRAATCQDVERERERLKTVRSELRSMDLSRTSSKQHEAQSARSACMLHGSIARSHRRRQIQTPRRRLRTVTKVAMAARTQSHRTSQDRQRWTRASNTRWTRQTASLLRPTVVRDHMNRKPPASRAPSIYL